MADLEADIPNLLTVEQAEAMPGAFRAFRFTNGDLMMGEFAWMAEHYECDGSWGCDEPQEVEEVVMVPVRVRVYPCHEVPKDDDDG